ncbi:S-adenosyl-L-methionine-dependent methyltransferase [Mycena belliarum]|uniref:S-adenosyl-L-methionine-dependent methyltransferase n=1 Tax=Mycena belliarum TaxID=1033014 RepID=A0AAD6XT56_9AGAR|nr:S-adenosyl-L-methionine-dependent methyltransferase [Mycena belliae]
MSADVDDDDDCYQAIEAAQFFYKLHGRRFGSLNTAYMLPVDTDEFKRSSLFHRLIQFMFNGRVYIGPVKETLQFGAYRKVLDLGTGRGFWAVDMCDLFSWVYVTGVDAAPIQFNEVPPRCRFEVWDINTPDMPYAADTFDLIHARCVHTGILNYPRFLSEIGRLVRPGGLVILIEPDLRQLADDQPEIEYTFGSGPRGWFTLWETYRSCLVSLGIDVTVPQRLGALLEQTGLFEEINEYTGTIPVGFYPEDPRILTVGQLQWMAYDLLLPGLKPMFLHLGLREARVDRIIKDAQQDLYHTEYRLTSHLHVVYALRRPH